MVIVRLVLLVTTLVVASPSVAQRWPIDRGKSDAPMSSPFGPQCAVCGVSSTRMHAGIDISVTASKNVVAVAPGTVRVSTDSWTIPSYGKSIIIEHESAGLLWYSGYHHLDSRAVLEGAAVTAGQVLGIAGNTGVGSADHLHFNYWTSGGLPVGDNETKHPLRLLGGSSSAQDPYAIGGIPGAVAVQHSGSLLKVHVSVGFSESGPPMFQYDYDYEGNVRNFVAGTNPTTVGDCFLGAFDLGVAVECFDATSQSTTAYAVFPTQSGDWILACPGWNVYSFATYVDGSFRCVSNAVAGYFTEVVAHAMPGRVVLDWEVSQASPAEYFQILRGSERESLGATPLHAVGTDAVRFRCEDVNVTPGQTYYYQLRTHGDDMLVSNVLEVPVPAFDLTMGIPAPNPTRDRSAVDVAVPVTERYELAVYDVAGRRVRLLASGEGSGLMHRIEWDGRDSVGNAVATGVYLLKLASPRVGEMSRKIAVIR